MAEMNHDPTSTPKMARLTAANLRERFNLDPEQILGDNFTFIEFRFGWNPDGSKVEIELKISAKETSREVAEHKSFLLLRAIELGFQQQGILDENGFSGIIDADEFTLNGKSISLPKVDWASEE